MDPTNLPLLVDSGDVFQQTGLVHRVSAPSGAGPHPTIVMLHGRYGDENAMWLFQHVTPAHWLKLAPRGIVDEPPDRFSWVHRDVGNWPTLAEFETAVAALHGFLNALPQFYNADPRQIYLMGFSQGAATAYAAAMRRPGVVRGIAGLVGFVPQGCVDSECLGALHNLPVFVATGRKDPLIPLEHSRQSAAILRQGRAKLTYREYETGHKLNRQGVRDLREWWRTEDEGRMTDDA